MSPTREPSEPGSGPRAAGWAWLATLPRGVTAHATRGPDPLANVRRLLDALGAPQRSQRVIHLAGSKGKGSTALFCEALLRAVGQRTLVYTSPHLERWTERFRVDGAEADAELAWEALQSVRAASRESGVQPGFFEALTVAAFVLARRAGVDWIVLEAGVGGRADATNVVDPRISVLTSVELEHTDRLGSTLAEIAREKAGIVKPGRPLVHGALPHEAEEPVRTAVDTAGAERVAVRRSPIPVRTAPQDGGTLWHRKGAELTAAGPGWHARTTLGVPGDTGAANAALALATIARLGIASAETLQHAARSLAHVQLPGRGEIVSTLPWVMVDVAHTAASAAALAETVAALEPPRVHILLSLSRGKDIGAVLRALLPLADAVTVTCADPDYSLDADELAAVVRERAPRLAVTALTDTDAALAHAAADRPGDTMVLATGSVYLAGRIRGAFQAATDRTETS